MCTFQNGELSNLLFFFCDFTFSYIVLTSISG